MLGLRRKLRTACQMLRKRILITLLFLLWLALLVLMFVAPQTSLDIKRTSIKRSRGVHPERKLILVYTKFPYEPWVPTVEEADDYEFTDWDGSPCEEPRCEVTYDKGLLQASDAVVVHGIARKPSIAEMTRNRPAHQRWVFYVKESPTTWQSAPVHFDGMFNWTATYRRDSDFFVPYGSYAKANPTTSGNAVNFALNRDKMAAFGVSNHCGGQRFAFVRALMKHIPVDVFGKCAPALDPSQTWQCPTDLSQGCAEELARHKFYLAFENCRCIDYITEKYWRNSLQRGLVPVVLGGSDYGPDLAIPGSFIDAADFDSVEALADYLKYLDQNDTAYNEYFQWRSKYKVVKHEFWLCRLCKALHDHKKTAKTYTKLSEFWGIDETCKIGTQHIWNMINRG